MIIEDFSRCAYATIHAFEDDIKKCGPEELENLIRHAIISSFLTTKLRFSGQYGKLYIALDGMKNFRYGITDHYKCRRKKDRKDDGMPWQQIFEVLTKIKAEAKEFWPWQIVWSDYGEADDVMAVLVEEVANKNMVDTGLMEEPEPVLLCTSDHDMYQLHRYKNVKQFCHRKQKYVDAGVPINQAFFNDWIMRGDDGDDVPNIFSDLAVFAEGRRQVPCIAKRTQPILEHKSIFDYKGDPAIEKRIRENYQLIHFDGIPIDVRDDILENFKNGKAAPKMKMMKYLAQNGCKRLLGDVERM